MNRTIIYSSAVLAWTLILCGPTDPLRGAQLTSIDVTGMADTLAQISNAGLPNFVSQDTNPHLESSQTFSSSGSTVNSHVDEGGSTMLADAFSEFTLDLGPDSGRVTWEGTARTSAGNYEWGGSLDQTRADATAGNAQIFIQGIIDEVSTVHYVFSYSCSIFLTCASESTLVTVPNVAGLNIFAAHPFNFSPATIRQDPASFESSAGGRLTVLYSVGATPLPGRTPDGTVMPVGPPALKDPEMRKDLFDQHNKGGSVDEPSDITSSFFTTPFSTPVVEGDYGQNDTVYFDPLLAQGYGFTTEGTNFFKTFEIPEALPQGDDTFVLAHNLIGYPLMAGQTFDFTTIDPAGVDSFLLLGIDEMELIDGGESNPPFVFGVTFADEGLAMFSTFPLVVPEPSTFALAAFGLVALVITGRRRRYNIKSDGNCPQISRLD